MPIRRANLTDIAEAAGVGTATVDRELNNRGNVRGTTIERARRTADQVGFPVGLFRDDCVYRVLLQDPDHLYYRELGEAVRRIPKFAVGRDFGSRSNSWLIPKTVWSQKGLMKLRAMPTASLECSPGTP